MADTATPPINPVNDAFAAAARSAMTSARSPLEAAASAPKPDAPANDGKTGINFDRAVVQHREVPNMDQSALDKARAADRDRQQQAVEGKNSPKPEPGKERQQPDGETDLEETDPSVGSEPWKKGKKEKPEKLRADQWREVNEERARLRTELEALKKNGATEPDITKHPEFTKLKQQHDEYLDALKQVAVERDPEFKSKFEPRREAILSKIRQVAGGARDKLENLFKLPAGEFRDAAIEQALSEFTPTTRATVIGQLQALATVDAERDAELAGRKAMYEHNQQAAFTQQQQAAREREAKLNTALEQQIKAWSDPEEGMPYLLPKEGDEKWNRNIEKRVALARSIFSGESDPANLAQAALKAAFFDMAIESDMESTMEVQKLREMYENLRGVQPGDSGLAASIMTTGRNDATARGASPFDRDYVNNFASALEEARQADRANAR